MSDLFDRREARRFSMNLPVRVLVNDANGPELKANTRDVSYRGLYFLTEAPFEKGSEIDFILTLPAQIISAGDVNIRCHGHVVRVQSEDQGKTGIAAKITALMPEGTRCSQLPRRRTGCSASSRCSRRSIRS